jgi:hypothetical protein
LDLLILKGLRARFLDLRILKELSFDTLLGDVERHPNSYDAAVVLNHPIAFLSRCNVREGKNARHL